MGLIWEKLWKWTEVAGKAAKFAHGAVGRPQFCRRCNGQGSYFNAQCNGQGLRWASQATCAMLYLLVDNIWTSLGATDALKSMVKKFRASWTKNSYQGPRAADPGALGRG